MVYRVLKLHRGPEVCRDIIVRHVMYRLDRIAFEYLWRTSHTKHLTRVCPSEPFSSYLVSLETLRPSWPSTSPCCTWMWICKRNSCCWRSDLYMSFSLRSCSSFWFCHNLGPKAWGDTEFELLGS